MSVVAVIEYCNFMVSLVSVAPMYTGNDELRGHWVQIQDDIGNACERMGVPFHLIVPSTMNNSEKFVNIHRNILENTVLGIKIAIAKFLEESNHPDECIVFVYEGSLDLARELTETAKNYPQSIFILNLFGQENLLGLPGGQASFLRTYYDLYFKESSELQEITEIPGNIKLIGETDIRHLIAESYGFKLNAKWDGISALSELAYKSSKNYFPNVTKLTILVPINISSINRKLLKSISKIEKLSKTMPIFSNYNLSFKFPIEYQDLKFTSKFLIYVYKIRHIIDLSTGARLDLRSYRDIFNDCDAVWLPYDENYLTQPSGKVLDSLVSCKMVITPAGTFGDREYSKWIRGLPTYRTNDELLQIMINLPRMSKLINKKLQRRKFEIASFYSAENSVKKLLKIGLVSSDKIHQPTSIPSFLFTKYVISRRNILLVLTKDPYIRKYLVMFARGAFKVKLLSINRYMRR
jgi:hypothetical protein